MRRTWTLAAVVGAVLTVATACAGSSGPPPATSLHLYEHDTAPAASIDLGAPGTGPGDLFIFTGDLFDGGPGGPKVGHADGSCTTTSGTPTTPGNEVCQVAFALQGGQLETQLVFDSGPFFSGAPAPIAITGGTGPYRGDRGDGTATIPNVADPSAVQFDLNTAP